MQMGWKEVSSQKYLTLLGGSALSQWKQIARGIQHGTCFRITDGRLLVVS